MEVDNEMDDTEDTVGHSEAYLAGISRPLKEDEELVMDRSAYRLYHHLDVESSSLSFDILIDNLGFDRKVELGGDPISLSCIAGTQASIATTNKLVLMKLCNLHPSKNKLDDDENENSASEDEEDLDMLPDVESAVIPHNGTVNRVRAQRYDGKYFAASWSELGAVHIWDLSRPLGAVNDSVLMGDYTRNTEKPLPVMSFDGHESEGYAVAWSNASGAEGHLATGDCTGRVYLWAPRPTGWTISPKPVAFHSESVEDIQWSPSEPTVFVTSSVDGTIRVWDTRALGSSRASQLCIDNAHNGSDVNVISWSPLQSASLLSGGDDGSIRVWDLRLVGKYCAPKGAGDGEIPCYSHSFDFHKKPITSVSWHPSEKSVFIASSEDDQASLWDIALEQDIENRTSSNPTSADDGSATEVGGSGLPVQLLFVHAGQHEIKEAHWHPQIPGVIMATALDGFNVFRTINI